MARLVGTDKPYQSETCSDLCLKYLFLHVLVTCIRTRSFICLFVVCSLSVRFYVVVCDWDGYMFSYMDTHKGKL